MILILKCSKDIKFHGNVLSLLFTRYRGRGGYYNRGMYRGGYRGNYRGQGQRNMRQNQGNQPLPNQPPPVAAAAGKN